MMNPRLKEALKHAWTEPRHFFFWLALLSFGGMALLLAGQLMMPYDIQKGALGLMIGFLQLGCVVGFVVGFPAFVLAWIPPLRRLLAWLLARRFIVLAAIITLVALAYTVENWRGRHAWNEYRRAQEAKGEKFDLLAFAPEPVPADQNFFESPLWQDLRIVKTNNNMVVESAGDDAKTPFNIYGPESSKAPAGGSWPKGKAVNLAAWQGYYRGTSNAVDASGDQDAKAVATMRRRYGLEPTPPPPVTNYFPKAKEPQLPAEDMLLALSRFETNRQLLLSTIVRPHARFWVNYDAGYAMLLPHLARMKATIQYLSMHAVAALHAGDRVTALQDVLTALRVPEGIKSEPALISHLVRIACLQLTLQPVWEGMADHLWTAEELTQLQQTLGGFDFLQDYEHAMRGERACCLWGIDYMRKRGMDGWAELNGSNAAEGQREAAECLGRAVYRLTPDGWFDQNKLSVSRNHEQYIFPTVDMERRTVSPTKAQMCEKALSGQPLNIYDLFSRMLMPALGNAASRFARAQNSVDLARIACALERYHLSHKEYPETLTALVPEFIEKLPHDIINGEPLKYRRTDNGRFILYSVGWNETDDGGKVGLNKSGELDVKTGDWVWQYPTPRK